MRDRVSRTTGGLFALLVVLWAAAPVSGQTFTVDVFADDGVALSTDVYLPLSFNPEPTVLIRTPYGKEGMKEVCLALVVLGYGCVAQDTRGRGDSGGVDTVFRNDADDGRTTIEWLADREWCDGNIGMFGGSAFAITQYLPSPGSDPALRSIAPAVATPDIYHHAFLQGGAIREALAVNWLEAQGSGYFYDLIRQHRLKDAWWDPVEVIDDVGSVHAKGLHLGGWYDIFGQGTLDGFSSFQQDGGSGAVRGQFLYMGPWTHGSLFTNTSGELTYPPNALVNPLDVLLPWYAATLKGESSEIDDWPAARIYLMGAVGEPGSPGNEWLDLDSWPPPLPVESWYLSADGRLGRAMAALGQVVLVSDPLDPVPTLGGANLFADLDVDGRPMGAGPMDQRSIEARTDVLTFTSDPLERPTTVIGPVRVTLWIRPDTRDLDLAVRLTDVYPDGRSMLVLDGIRRARMRCGDDTECLLTPGVPVELTIELWSTAMAFNTGHSIRIAVSGSNSPRFEVNPNNGGDLNLPGNPVVARPTLLVGGLRRSRLELPTLTLVRRATGRLVPASPGVRLAPPGWNDSSVRGDPTRRAISEVGRARTPLRGDVRPHRR